MLVHTRHKDFNLDHFDSIFFDAGLSSTEICLFGTGELNKTRCTKLNFDFKLSGIRFLYNMLEALLEGQEEFDATGYEIVFGQYDLNNLRSRIKTDEGGR